MGFHRASASLVVVSAFLWAMAVPTPASAAAKGSTEPVPIPGGFDIGGGQVIHVFGPGAGDPNADPGFSPDAEPSTITNFNGLAAYAVFAGNAADAHGNAYQAILDMRIFDGEYVSSDGTHHHGTFGFI